MKKLFFSLLIIPMMFLWSALTVKAGYVYNGNEYQYCFENFGNSSYKQVAYFNVADGWYPFLCGSSPTDPSKVFSYKDCQYVILTNGSSIVDPYYSSQFDSICSGVFIEGSSVSYSIRLESMLHDIYNLSFVSNFPVFESHNAAMKYYSTGDTTGAYFIPEPPVPPFDPYNNDYSEDIPAPQIFRDGDKIMFSNASSDMYLLANIRWYSVDDITLFKESLSWKYRPDSIIHSDLDWLLSVDDLYPSVNGVNLYDLGVQSFQEFLSAYPVENRTYLGGTNALGNYLFGYNDALSTLKMILGQIDSSFNAPELFFRYYVPLDDGTYKCGKWTKYSRSLPSGASDGAIDGKWNVQYQVSDAPLTSDDVIGSKPYDNSGMTTYTSKDNSVVVDFDSPDYTISIDNLNQITSLFGQFPTFVSTVFCFLPSWILSLIGCTITLLVGLAVYHALRG